MAIEATPKKAFATAVDWPGWSRSGKTEELALDALAAAAPRYAIVAEEAGEAFPAGAAAISRSSSGRGGGGGTDFGVPSSITDARPTAAQRGGRRATRRPR